MQGKLFKYLSEISTPLRGILGTNYLKKSFDRCASLEQQRRDPSELLNKKNQDVRFYDTMLQDDTVSGTHELLKQIVLSVNGGVEPIDDTPEAAEQAQFHNDWLYKMTPNVWDAFDNTLDAKMYGYKCAEIIWASKDGKWVPEQLKFKHSYLFDFDYDEYGNLQELLVGYYVGNDGKVTGEDIAKKFMIMVWPYAKDGNYYGQSVLDAVYLQYFQKYNIERYWATYLQNFGMPIVELKYDVDDIKSAELDTLKELAENWQNNMYFLTPSKRHKTTGELLGKVEFVPHEVKATSTDAYEKSIRYLDQCIKRKMFLPDNIGYTTTDTGSYAKSQTELSIFEKNVKYHHGKLEDWINPLIRMVHDFNFGPAETYPEWKFEEADKNLNDTMLNALITTGIVDPSEKWIRNYIGIPSLSAEEQEEIDEKKKERAALTPKTYNPFDKQEQPKEDTEPEDKEDEKPEEMKAVAIPFDAEKAKKEFTSLEDEFVIEYERIMAAISERMVQYVRSNYDPTKKNYKWLEELSLYKTSMLKKLYSVYLSKVYIRGVSEALSETTKRASKVIADKLKDIEKYQLSDEDEWLDRYYIEKQLKEYGSMGALTRDQVATLRGLKHKAGLAAADDEARILKDISQILRKAIDVSKPLQEVIPTIESALRDDRKQYALTIARTNQSTSYNAGRMDTFRSDTVRPYIEAYQYQAIMDDATTEFCAEHDGQIIRADDPDLQRISPPNHFNAVLEGTEITTKEGKKKIQNIVPGDMVLTHKGNYEKVLSVMTKKHSGSIRNIQTDTGKIIYITKEHPCLTLAGWKIAGDLKVGDVLFQNHSDSFQVTEKSIIDPNNFKPLFNENGIPYEVMIGSVAGEMIFSIDFDNQKAIFKNEVGYITSECLLENVSPGQVASYEKFVKDSLGLSGVASIGNRFGDSIPEHYFRIIARIVGDHSFRLGGVNGAVFLAETESPVIASALMKRWIGVSNSNLVNSTPGCDSVLFTPEHKNSFSASETTLDGTKGEVLPKMVGSNNVFDSVSVSKIDHDNNSFKWVASTIMSIVDEDVNSSVWNLSVEKDNSYHANDIIVHNCRSVLVPIFITDSSDPSSYFNDYEKKFDTWGKGVSETSRKPAEGFY
jgi:SPP1 gp7 family putative phage head morphogenesis protein